MERESETRSQRIDPRLEAAGWSVAAYDPSHPSPSHYGGRAVEEFPTENGPADYALCSQSAVVGVVEAKKVSFGAQSVLTQAERYARGLSQNPWSFDEGLKVPFLYSTNGESIWFRDARDSRNRSREIATFHTQDALSEMLSTDLDSSLSDLAELRPNQLLRPYQVEANEAVENAIRQRKRQMLLAMATGTGKTLTMVSQVHRLMRSGVARRILFLVDRRALAAQAVRAFASYQRPASYDDL